MMRYAVAVLLALAIPVAANATTILIVNNDGAGVGFNDPTAAAPVGGNNGTTLGQQRLNVFNAAAAIWASKISSPITIKIRASFGSLSCSANQGILGSAGATNWIAPSVAPNTWYPIALASALDNHDYAADYFSDGASINAQFNSAIGGPNCLAGLSWYLGLDGNHGGQIDLETTLLHEFAHGLGFSGLIDASAGTGAFPNGLPDIFSKFMFDNSVLFYWNMMSNGQRVTSTTNTLGVVWNSTNVNIAAATVLVAGKDVSGHPYLFTPNPIQQGSSIYHFDTSASPNQLMEPVLQSDVTHNVDTPNDLTARVMQDIGWPQPVTLPAPANVVANGANASVSLTWSAAAGATSYHVYRSTNGTTFTSLGVNPAGTSYTDSTAVTGTAYLYRVRSFNGTTESVDSNTDLAYAFTFTDSALATGASGTTVKGAHITELRTAINAIRTSLTVLGAASFTDPTLTALSTQVKAVHITQLRTALDAARAALGLPALSYTDSTLATGSAGTRLKKVHITELRNGVL